MVNNVAKNNEKLKQLSKRVRSCTATHKKARRHVSSLEFDIKDAAGYLEHLHTLARSSKISRG